MIDFILNYNWIFALVFGYFYTCKRCSRLATDDWTGDHWFFALILWPVLLFVSFSGGSVKAQSTSYRAEYHFDGGTTILK